MLAPRIVRAFLLGCSGFTLLTLGFAPLPADDAQPTAEGKAAALEEDVTQGALRVLQDDGTVVECPLRHTDVQADVSGFIARVKVTQTFYNPTDERIEAVYVFPLPHEAAVDEMTMVIGDRKIVGVIKRRAEARQIYEAALAAGQIAALLEQERPNIFTQSVGNIEPAQEVRIEISYVDVLAYDMGTYEFHFPMVVGPRFMPGAPIAMPQPTPAELRGAVSPPEPDTTRVPDASRISPPVLKPGFRNGHDISLSLRLDAGVPVMGLEVANHEATIDRKGDRQATVTLSSADSIPNKDFVLRYHVVGKKPELAVLAHTGDYTDSRRLGRGYFMLMMQPKEDERLTKSPPREIVFLLDVSGSMSGAPTEKVKESMRDMLQLCREVDTMQVITFANQARQLFEQPVPVNPGNITQALNFTQGLRGGGGTHMLEGVKRSIDQPIDKERLRIVIMLTDGYIGNEAEIIEHVGTSCGDQIRFWAIGIGSSPNMFLIDGVAKQGGGMGKRLGLQDEAAGLAEEVITRIQRAQLTKIRIDWGGLRVAETYPAKVPELWAGRPVILFGRYTDGGETEIQINGLVEGEPVSWTLAVDLPKQQPEHDVLAKVWARRKIEDLMQQTYYGGSPAVEEAVTAMALDYRLMSQYTSFVAVDADKADETASERLAQPPRRMLVPVPLPAGTRWEGFFGDEGDEMEIRLSEEAELARQETMLRLDLRVAGGMGGMGGMGMGGGAMRGRPGGAPRVAMDRLARLSSSLAAKAPATPALQMGQAAHPYGVRPAPGAAAYRYAQPSPAPMAQTAPGLHPSRRALGREVTSYEVGAGSFGGRNARPVVGDVFTTQVLTSAAESLAKRSAQHLEASRKHQESKQWSLAWHECVPAYFLASAAALRGNYQATETAQAALADLETIREQLVDDWKEERPELDAKLDLVLRDVTIDDALKALAHAADLDIQLLEGSVADAAELLPGYTDRITYLDLRGTSAVQALDWLLQPLRMTWQPSGPDSRVILAGSHRRMPQLSAWVYDVSVIALPLQAEFTGIEGTDNLLKRAGEFANHFLNGIRGVQGVPDQGVTWFAPGQLLVIGDSRAHKAVAETIARLSNPEAKVPLQLASLHRQIRQRFAERREEVEKRLSSRRRWEALQIHDEFGWSLLAAALEGQVDDQALTELRIVWRGTETKELLEGDAAGIALRSAWTIVAASRLVPEDPQLAELAETVHRLCRPAAQRSIAAFPENREDLPQLVESIYAALLMDSGELNRRVLAALPESSANPSVAAAASAARGLLADPAPTDINMFDTIDGMYGEDLTVLTAMACRRMGGQAWDGFRVEMTDLLSHQPLPGSVIVLIHRLAGDLPLWATR